MRLRIIWTGKTRDARLRALIDDYAERLSHFVRFEVTELRVAQPDEGSWIAMAFDSQGRLVISREDQGFLRMKLDDARKSVARIGLPIR